MIKPLQVGLLILLLLPLTARSQASIEVKTGDNPLTIKGWVGDENSFIGNIGVTLKGSPGSTPLKPNINKSDLKTANGTEMIGRQSVAVTGDETLTLDTMATYQVKVTGVKEPGEYTGTIDFQLPGQGPAPPGSVKVIVVASVRPALSLMPENDRLQANLVSCSYDCWLARLLLPTAAFQNKTDLGFEKSVGAPLLISDINIGVKGDQTRFKLTDKTLGVCLDQLRQSQQPGGSSEPGAQPLPPPQCASSPEPSGTATVPPLTGKRYVTIPVDISHKIPADHYTGTIYLTVAGQSSPLKVPVDFNVRSGPFWPLLWLLLSILLGRLYKYMQDKGNAIADALESINRLEFRLQDADPKDAEIIAPMLRAARDLVHQDKAAEAAAAVNPIPARLATLGELRQIEARLTGKDPTTINPILGDIRQAREHIRNQQDDQAKEFVKKIKDALAALAATPPASDSDKSNLADLADAVERADAASKAASVLGSVRNKARHRLRSALVTISGLSAEFHAEATLFLGRPILWLALVLGLLALGIKTLYVDNPIFGANPFIDFLGLAFWGLSADVASRTLSGLRTNDASRPAGS